MNALNLSISFINEVHADAAQAERGRNKEGIRKEGRGKKYMHELSSSMTRKTTVPPSMSISGGSASSEASLKRLAGGARSAGGSIEGRFSAVGVTTMEFIKFLAHGGRGSMDRGSGIGSEGVCTGREDAVCTSPERLFAETEAFGCGVFVCGSSEIVTMSVSPFLMPISVISLSQVSGAPSSIAFEGYKIFRPI